MTPARPTADHWITIHQVALRLDMHRKTALKVITRGGVRVRQFDGFPPRYHAGDVDRLNAAAITTAGSAGRDGAA